MKAVILAAGKSTRMYPLTLTKPKHLLKVAGKTILEHNLDALKGLVDEAIIVVGYKKEMIIGFLGKSLEKSYNGIKITYVEQKEQLGTGHALLQAKSLLTGRFVFMNGDDIYAKKDIESCLKHKYCLLVKEVTDYEKWGIVTVSGSKVTGVIEKPGKFVGNLANTQLFVLDQKIFELNLKKSKRGEYEVTDYLTWLAGKETVNFEAVKEYWLPIGYPWHILDANEFLLSKLKKSEIKGEVSRQATIAGNVVVGEGSKILPGVYIEGNVIFGKNCKIGPNCYIRGSTLLGDNCRVGQSVEIKNSIIGDNSKVPHLSYVGDSVIGENVNFAAGTIVANLRHDQAGIKTMVNGKLVDTGRKKFGTVVGDNVHTGINTSIYPGRKLWPNTATIPGEVVKIDKIK
ncbi:MAG: bifunctional sugar-1-phosphate nucleotidylyltransferase/acetyltransferase [Nanoarchaeota archaeon]